MPVPFLWPAWRVWRRSAALSLVGCVAPAIFDGGVPDERDRARGFFHHLGEREDEVRLWTLGGHPYTVSSVYERCLRKAAGRDMEVELKGDPGAAGENPGGHHVRCAGEAKAERAWPSELPIPRFRESGFRMQLSGLRFCYVDVKASVGMFPVPMIPSLAVGPSWPDPLRHCLPLSKLADERSR